MDERLQDREVDTEACSRCGGDMTVALVRFCVCDANPPLMIERVPARVCRRCGGEVFSDATMAAFENVRDGGVGTYRLVGMRVYDYVDTLNAEPRLFATRPIPTVTPPTSPGYRPKEYSAGEALTAQAGRGG